MLHVGTDEAGYGPLLGPLVIGAAMHEYDGPRDSLALPGSGESKDLYSRGGRNALARGLAPYLDADLLLPGPLHLGALLGRLSVRQDPRAAYDWYGEVEDATATPAAQPEGFRGLLVNPICEREFNAECGELGGKGHLLFKETMRLVREALERHPHADAEVVCDKHGGRNRYAALLLTELGPSTLVAECEGPVASRYRLTLGGRKLRVRFEAKADGHDPLAGLASMIAKYVRELFMEGLNAYFRPARRRTATHGGLHHRRAALSRRPRGAPAGVRRARQRNPATYLGCV
ncbi:MAG: hypothetical protein HC813_02935 [Planctomycetes bacterium]|nr:hypothetical protein [Planctomycetota bacterium]